MRLKTLAKPLHDILYIFVRRHMCLFFPDMRGDGSRKKKMQTVN